jgi:hypothetical protein
MWFRILYHTWWCLGLGSSLICLFFMRAGDQKGSDLFLAYSVGFFACFLVFRKLPTPTYKRWVEYFEYCKPDLHVLSADVRADAISLGRTQHQAPLVGKVKYHRLVRPGWFRLPFQCGVLTDKWYETLLTVSFEMLSQLSTQKNLSMLMTELEVAQRLDWAASTIHSVNLDRALSVFGDQVVQDSILVAFGLYRLQQQKRARVVFPRSPSTN